MRLEFRVLWFENQPDDVQPQIDDIREHVKNVGFIPIIDMQPDGGKIEELAHQQQKYDDFDLVVVDYDLGKPGMNGDQVAKQVRRGFGFTDIIFYSGHTTLDLRKMVQENAIDGVYCLERRRLAERLGDHIDQVVRRMSRLEAMRGLAMGTVGKCDDELRLILSGEFSASDAARRKEIVELLDSLVADGAKVASEKYLKCQSFDDRLYSRAVTSFHLQKLTLALLKGNAACAENRKRLSRYDDEVLGPRNILGHAIERRGENGWEVLSHGNPSIAHADFPKLRQNMSLHLENISAVGSLLVGQRG